MQPTVGSPAAVSSGRAFYRLVRLSGDGTQISKLMGTMAGWKRPGRLAGLVALKARQGQGMGEETESDGNRCVCESE